MEKIIRLADQEWAERIAVSAYDLDGLDALSEAERATCHDLATWCAQRVREATVALRQRAEAAERCIQANQLLNDQVIADLRTRLHAAEAALRAIAGARRIDDPDRDVEEWVEFADRLRLLARRALRAGPADGRGEVRGDA